MGNLRRARRNLRHKLKGAYNGAILSGATGGGTSEVERRREDDAIGASGVIDAFIEGCDGTPGTQMY